MTTPKFTPAPSFTIEGEPITDEQLKAFFQWLKEQPRIATVTGELVRAGTRDGVPSLLIHSTEDQIHDMRPLPLYQKATIYFVLEDEKEAKP